MISTYKQLNQNLDELKLFQIKDHLTEVADLVSGNTLSFTDGLLKLTNYEVDNKLENASKSMVKVAAFPFIKELSDFDFDFQQGLNKQEILELATLRFMENNENIVFLGNSGVGKTHLATSIGIIAAKKRISTYFIKCHDLIQQLKKAKMENRLESKLKYINRYKLLIIDELGYLSIDENDSNLFFQLIDMRYEKKSTIITTNMNFGDWDKVFNGALVANAILDRILHHSNVISITGNSYRIKDYITEDIN
jgi:DNA replication protein DnaC